MTGTLKRATLPSMLNVRDLIRAWCAETGYPVSDLIGRGRAARESKLISQRGHGVNASAATARDGAVLLLSILVSEGWKKVPQEVEKYGGLSLIEVECFNWIDNKYEDPGILHFPQDLMLLDAFEQMLEKCGSQGIFRLGSLKVDRSEIYPLAHLAIDIHVLAEGDRRWSYFLTFRKPDQADRYDVVEASFRLMDRPLNTMADLLAPNIAVANYTRSLPGTKETGSSAPTDEPAPSNNETPRGANPEATNSANREPSERERESQAGIESRGKSSGGASAAT
jgi:hypothetical protein